VALSIFPASAIAEAPLLAGIAHVAIRVSDLTKSLDFLQNGMIGKVPTSILNFENLPKMRLYRQDIQ
jgi:hypothetical protein